MPAARATHESGAPAGALKRYYSPLHRSPLSADHDLETSSQRICELTATDGI